MMVSLKKKYCSKVEILEKLLIEYLFKVCDYADYLAKRCLSKGLKADCSSAFYDHITGVDYMYFFL